MNSAAAAPVTPLRNSRRETPRCRAFSIGEEARAPDGLADERRVGNGKELTVGDRTELDRERLVVAHLGIIAQSIAR